MRAGLKPSGCVVALAGADAQPPPAAGTLASPEAQASHTLIRAAGLGEFSRDDPAVTVVAEGMAGATDSVRPVHAPLSCSPLSPGDVGVANQSAMKRASVRAPATMLASSTASSIPWMWRAVGP